MPQKPARKAFAVFASAATAVSMQLIAPAVSASSQVELSTLTCAAPQSSSFFDPTAQVFEAPATGTISEVSVKLWSGGGSDDVLISILNAPGGIPAGTPASPATSLATGTIPRASITSNAYPGQVFSVSLTNSVDVVAGQTYAMLFGTASDPYGGVSFTGIPLFTQGNCSTDTGGSRRYWDTVSSSWITVTPTPDNLVFAVYVTVTDVALSSDDRPAPWLKAIGREADAQCPEGMHPSWAMWPNNGTGGFTCEWREEYAGGFAWRELPGFYG